MKNLATGVMTCSTETLQSVDSIILYAERLGMAASVEVKALGTALLGAFADALLSNGFRVSMYVLPHNIEMIYD